jgi:hypothetical protein
MEDRNPALSRSVVARVFAFNVYELPRICEICQKEGRVEVHHKDGDSDNNSRENLWIVCRRCYVK